MTLADILQKCRLTNFTEIPSAPLALFAFHDLIILLYRLLLQLTV